MVGHILDWMVAGVKVSWLQFTAFILVFGTAQLVGGSFQMPFIIEKEVRVESPQAVPTVAPPAYERKNICPETAPAHFLGVEVRTELWLLTGYAIGDGNTPGRNTADGWQEGIIREVRPSITAACSWDLPLGTMVVIEGLGPRICEDRGMGPDRRWIDVAFETPLAAQIWGRRWVRVAVIRPEGSE